MSRDAGDARAIEDLVADLVADAPRMDDDDATYWCTVTLLQKRDPAAVWAVMEPCARDADANVRLVVPYVLRYLGGASHPLLEPTIALFRAMLATESDPRVIAAVGLAFVDIHDPAAVELMVPFRGHASAEVRSAVTHALLAHREPEAIATLIELTGDSSDYVREWAYFGLAQQLGERGDGDLVDTPTLRAALERGLLDQDDGARGEAAVGLALRNDVSAIPVVRAELLRDAPLEQFIVAAELLGTEELGVLARAHRRRRGEEAS